MSRKLGYLFLTFSAFLFFLIVIGQTFGREDFLRRENASLRESSSLKEPSFVKNLENDFLLQYKLFKKSTLENGVYSYQIGNYKVFFTVLPQFQKALEDEFKRFKVKYGAFVALDPKTGKVLSVVSSLNYPDLALKRSYPAASTFKIITSAAALELGIATPNTVLKCGGLGDSCSPSVWLNSNYQVLRDFKTSFATSANPFFGNLGRLVGKKELLRFAELFGFNSSIYDFPWGVLRPPLDDYEVALLAAGLGDVRVSPFHEALIAQTVVNNGVMMKPYLVDKVVDLRTGRVYRFYPEVLRKVISPKTAREIRRMMLLTVKEGTVSRKKYFRLLSLKYPNLIIGGKSGTLTEKSYPEGRCEWFTGFFSYKGHKVAFSSVAVNGWTYYISGYEISALAAADFAKLLKGGKVRCAFSAR